MCYSSYSNKNLSKSSGTSCQKRENNIQQIIQSIYIELVNSGVISIVIGAKLPQTVKERNIGAWVSTAKSTLTADHMIREIMLVLYINGTIIMSYAYTRLVFLEGFEKDDSSL